MFVFASTLCKYDLRNGDLFVLSWAMVRRVCLESVSSVVFKCGSGVCSILLFCDYGGVYCCEVGVYVLLCNGVWVLMMFVVYLVLLNVIYFLSMRVCLCIVGLCSWCDGCCPFCLICDVYSSRCSWSSSILFRRVDVVCLCPAFFLLQFVIVRFVLFQVYGCLWMEHTWGWPHDYLICSRERLLLFPHTVAFSVICGEFSSFVPMLYVCVVCKFGVKYASEYFWPSVHGYVLGCLFVDVVWCYILQRPV